jgi:hypothetical protein
VSVNREVPLGGTAELWGAWVPTLGDPSVQFGNSEKPEHRAVAIFQYLRASQEDLFDNLPSLAEQIDFPKDSTMTRKSKGAAEFSRPPNVARSQCLGDSDCLQFSMLEGFEGVCLWKYARRTRRAGRSLVNTLICKGVFTNRHIVLRGCFQFALSLRT